MSILVLVKTIKAIAILWSGHQHLCRDVTFFIVCSSYNLYLFIVIIGIVIILFIITSAVIVIVVVHFQDGIKHIRASCGVIIRLIIFSIAVRIIPTSGR